MIEMTSNTWELIIASSKSVHTGCFSFNGSTYTVKEMQLMCRMLMFIDTFMVDIFSSHLLDLGTVN